MSVPDHITTRDKPEIPRFSTPASTVLFPHLANRLKKLTLRKVLLKLHLYISLVFGGFLVLAGLTGSLLVFGHELDEWLNADIMHVAAAGQRRPLLELISIADQASPFKSSASSLVLPKTPQNVLIVRYKVHQHENMSGHNHQLHEVMVNPYSGQVLGDRDRNAALIPYITQLHYKLLADDIGKIIMGITALLTMILSITGIYLWWPKLNKIKQAFVIKRNASFTRFNYDLHKTVGIYTCIVLFCSGLSGVYFNLPQIFKPVVSFFSPLTELPKNIKSKTAGGEVIPPEAAIRSVEAAYPGIQVQRLTLPESADGSYLLNARQADEIRNSGSTVLWVDQYSGKILLVRDPKQFAAGNAFINLQLPIHNGEILGMPGRLFLLAVGFAPLILMITGVIHWLKKRQAKRIHNLRLKIG